MYLSNLRVRTTLALSASLVALGACPGAARAADPADAPVGQRVLEEVVVTARRKDENIQTVPIAVSVVSNEVMENFRFEDLNNLQSLEPSFSTSASSGRANAPVYSLRGIRPTEAIYGQDPTVAIYLADVVQSPAQGSNLGFYDLDSIQVLKGPQGTLFGRNTIGGAILLTPRKPGEVFAGDIMVGAGSYDLYETQFGVDLPLSDNFQMRISGRTIDGGDYQTNVAPGPGFGQELGGQNTRSLRATAVGRFTPDIDNTLMFTYDDKRTNGRGTTIQAVNPDHARAGILPGFAEAVTRARNRSLKKVESDLAQKDDVEAWSVTNTTTAKLSDSVSFKLIANYREVDTDVVFDLDATSLAGVLTSEQQATLDHMSFEAQLLGTALDDRLDWVSGLYFYQEEGEESSPGSFFGSRLLQSGEVDNKSYSAFLQGSYALTPDLTLSLGGRLNKDKKSMVVQQSMGGTLCLLQVADSAGTGLARLPMTACEISLSDSFSQPTGTIALDYKLSDDVLVYATSRFGYRSGGFNLRASLPVQYEPFQEEKVIDIELGSKADWTLGAMQMRTNFAIFYQEYDDIQRTVAVANPLSNSPASVVTNAAAAEVFGVELQQTIRLTENLTLQFNLAYNDPEYNKWVDPATGADLSSTPFYFTPEYAGNVMLTYETKLPSNMGVLNFGVNAAYTDDIWINALHTNVTIAQHPDSILPLLQQESYWLFDANIGWREVGGTPLDLNLYIKNLTDEEYKVGGVQLYSGASGFISAAYGEPRTYGAQLRYRF